MSERNPIAECLMSSRNILLGGRSTENVLACLASVLTNINSISVASTREIVRCSVLEVVDQIKSKNFVSAGLILNLIHNLPLDKVSETHWDVDYFLSMELPAFLEHFDEIKSSRKLALFICGQIAARYSEL